jgi:hypothetical protein
MQNHSTQGTVADPKGAARYLELAVITLAKYRVSGTGPRYFKIGRNVRYRIADLDEWLDRHARLSTSEYPTNSSRKAAACAQLADASKPETSAKGLNTQANVDVVDLQRSRGKRRAMTSA